MALKERDMRKAPDKDISGRARSKETKKGIASSAEPQAKRRTGKKEAPKTAAPRAKAKSSPRTAARTEEKDKKSQVGAGRRNEPVESVKPASKQGKRTTKSATETFPEVKRKSRPRTAGKLGGEGDAAKALTKSNAKGVKQKDIKERGKKSAAKTLRNVSKVGAKKSEERITAKKATAPAASREKKREKPGKEIRKTGKSRNIPLSGRVAGRKRKGITGSMREGRRAETDKPGSMEWELLPPEYGENNVTVMTVDPHTLFAFWEIREDALREHEGVLDIRVYDVTGLDSIDADRHFDISGLKRIGKGYIDVLPAREFIADIGILSKDIFIWLARSRRVSTPGTGLPEDGLPSGGQSGRGLRIGY